MVKHSFLVLSLESRVVKPHERLIEKVSRDFFLYYIDVYIFPNQNNFRYFVVFHCIALAIQTSYCLDRCRTLRRITRGSSPVPSDLPSKCWSVPYYWNISSVCLFSCLPLTLSVCLPVSSSISLCSLSRLCF